MQQNQSVLIGEVAMADEVRYSTDVVEQGARFGLVGRSGEFCALSNFKIDILSEVQAGEHSGFTCSVTFYTGEQLG